MASDAPPPEKPRLPQPISLGGGWGFLYALLAIGFFGAGAYLHFGRGVALTEPSIVVAALGGIWFVARAVMTLRKKP